MKKRPFVVGFMAVVLVIATVFVFQFYEKNQAQEQPQAKKQAQPRTWEQRTERAAPFWEVIAGAETESENLLIKKGLIPPRPPGPPPVACGLGTCADVRKFSIAEDGSMVIVLAGTTKPDLEGKLIVLTPNISNGAVTWKCQTNAPKELVPTKEDDLPGWECTRLP